jgi:serine/threonine protein kinase
LIEGNAVKILESLTQQTLEPSDEHCLLKYFAPQALLLERQQFKQRDAMGLLLQIRNMVKTSTKKASFLEGNVLFDGLIPLAHGQADTVLQYCLRSGVVCCAKIGPSSVIQKEVDVCRLVSEGCPTVMPLLDMVELSHDRLAMISPFYPLPLSQFLGVKIPEEILVNVALCGLASVKAFSRRRKCHGDMKPSNMMFGAHDNVIITIDFGSSSSYDDEHALNASTAMYCLDSSPNSLDFDLTCVATSICSLSLPSLSGSRSKKELQTQLSREGSLLGRIANLCLENLRGIDDVWTKTLALIHSHEFVNPQFLVKPELIWPKA